MGPGRKADTCPIATAVSLKALSTVLGHANTPAVDRGIEALLSHWEHQGDYKLKMIGIGTDFRKLKYPFVWYDILHVVDVLTRFEQAHNDSRLQGMVAEIMSQRDQLGRVGGLDVSGLEGLSLIGLLLLSSHSVDAPHRTAPCDRLGRDASTAPLLAWHAGLVACSGSPARTPGHPSVGEPEQLRPGGVGHEGSSRRVRERSG